MIVRALAAGRRSSKLVLMYRRSFLLGCLGTLLCAGCAVDATRGPLGDLGGELLLAPRFLLVESDPLAARWLLPLDTRFVLATEAEPALLDAAVRGLQSRFVNVQRLSLPPPGSEEASDYTPAARVREAAGSPADVLVFLHHGERLGRHSITVKVRGRSIPVPLPAIDRSRTQITLLDVARDRPLRTLRLHTRTALGRRLTPVVLEEAFRVLAFDL